MNGALEGEGAYLKDRIFRFCWFGHEPPLSSSRAIGQISRSRLVN